MLYLIGIGLDKKDISSRGKEIIENAEKIYLESYTVDFPYSKEELEKEIGEGIKSLDRKDVESDKLVEEAKDKDIVLLVYGSPLMATTHISLVSLAENEGVEYKIIHNASIFDALANTGLQPYKFGKIASLPDWNNKGKSKSFIKIVENNMKIKAHSLILIDIGLDLGNALEELEEASDNKIKRLIIGSRLGIDDEKIYYDSIENLKELDIKKPYCFIIPSKLHFKEREALEKISE